MAITTTAMAQPSRANALMMQFATEYFEDALGLLSARERHLIGRIGHPVRSMEWVGSRVLAKFAYLEQQCRLIPTPWREVEWAEVRDLADSETYRAIEILKHSGLEGPPQLIDSRRGTRHCGISISHKWPIVSVGFSPLADIPGVDIEQVTVFGADFRQFYFQTERWFLASLNEQPHVDFDRFCTLLWTLKEAFFKSCLSADKNVSDVEVVLREIPSLVLVERANEPEILQESMRVAVGWKGCLRERTTHLIANRKLIGTLLVPK